MEVIKKIAIVAVLVASLVFIYSFVSDAYEERKKRERLVKQTQETITRAIVGNDAYEEGKRKEKDEKSINLRCDRPGWKLPSGYITGERLRGTWNGTSFSYW